MTPYDSDAAIAGLRDDGYCVVRGLLDPPLIERLQRLSRRALADAPAEHRRQNRSQGSLINLSDYPAYAELIAAPALIELFAGLGFTDPVFSSGYLISKPPQGPALFWHQDWWGWDDPVSYTETICQVFVMVYLTATTPHNGCLRVLPGSHRRRHPLHAATAAHSPELSRVDDPDDELYRPLPEQRLLAVEPGDVVVGDARLLHGAGANRSDQERALLTLWYHPHYETLADAIKARIRQVFLRREVDTDPAGGVALTPTDWPPPQRDRVAALLPRYRGDAPPHGWNRNPQLSCLSGGDAS